MAIMIIDAPDGTRVEVIVHRKPPTDGASIGFAASAGGGFERGDLVYRDTSNRAVKRPQPVHPSKAERDYWIIGEAVKVDLDGEYKTTKYTFPDGEVVWCSGLNNRLRDFSDVQVKKKVNKPTEPERDYWLLDEATAVSDTPTLDATTYTFPDGAVHHIDFASIRDMAQQGTLAATRVPKLKAGTTCVSWEFGDDSKWAMASGTCSMDEMRVIAGTQTPRQWLDFRVSEIAEQGRL